MVDLYKKENLFISTVVEPSVGVSEKAPKTVDVEATLKIAVDVASLEVEKGNLDKTLNYAIFESRRTLGLEDLNDVIDSTENMDVDEPDNQNVVDNSVQPSLEKPLFERMLDRMLELPWANKTNMIRVLESLKKMS